MFAIGIAAASVAVIITAYAAAGVSTYVAQPPVAERTQISVPPAQTQMPNRPAKSDRVALLLNGPSYTNFDPSYLRLAISAPTLNRHSGPSDTGILNDAQIAGIESRLRLTQHQASYWPAVAAALRDVGRRYFHRRYQRQNMGQRIDVNSPEVKRLIEAAAPLIQTLSEVQKREVRQLVRIIGLETVASHI